MSDDRTGMTQLPLQLARQILTHKVDLEGELKVLLDDGQRRITIGLGHGVDIPLLPSELQATDVEFTDRELVVCAIRAEPSGYVVERGWSNFGLYTMSRRHRSWQSVPWMNETRGLMAGDKVALGSTPAEAIQFRLPDSALVSRPRARSRRHEVLDEQRAATPRPPTPRPPPVREATPLPADLSDHAESLRDKLRRKTLRDTPPGALRRTSEPAGRRVSRPTAGLSRRYQRSFELAIRHWNYDMLSFGGDPSSVVHLDDPDLAALKAALVRSRDEPGRGYDLFVRNPVPDLWAAPAGQEPTALTAGAVVKLKGPGNQIGFGRYVVELPEPVVPSPRFGPSREPNRAEIAEVLGLSLVELADAAVAKTRYRELARQFHPDRHGGDPGHTSRFLELQTCWEALERGG